MSCESNGPCRLSAESYIQQCVFFFPYGWRYYWRSDGIILRFDTALNADVNAQGMRLGSAMSNRTV